jgi:hypothetical protein
MWSAIRFNLLQLRASAKYRVERDTLFAYDNLPHHLHAEEQYSTTPDDTCRPKDTSLLLLLLPNLLERPHRPNNTAGQ